MKILPFIQGSKIFIYKMNAFIYYSLGYLPIAHSVWTATPVHRSGNISGQPPPGTKLEGCVCYEGTENYCCAPAPQIS